ncbi:MAG: hypothetical protein R2695_16285 [Acidimicrobiales bacterium]
MTDAATRHGIRFAVLGVDHPRAIELTAGLLAAGAECVGWADPSDAGSLFAALFPGLPRHGVDELLAAGPDLAVVVAIPVERAALAVAAMDAGADVLTAKPGVIDPGQLELVAAATRRTGRRWWVAFTEHLTSRAVIRAER